MTSSAKRQPISSSTPSRGGSRGELGRSSYPHTALNKGAQLIRWSPLQMPVQGPTELRLAARISPRNTARASALEGPEVRAIKHNLSS
jgi:hypothetical protein